MDGGRSRKNERPNTPPHAETAFSSAQPNHVSKALIAASGKGKGQCFMRKPFFETINQTVLAYICASQPRIDEGKRVVRRQRNRIQSS
jgi:hypothetical protein